MILGNNIRKYAWEAYRIRSTYENILRNKEGYENIDEIDVQWYLRNRDQFRIHEERKAQQDLRKKILEIG